MYNFPFHLHIIIGLSMIPSFSSIFNSGLLNEHTGVLVFNAVQLLGIPSQFKGESETATAYSKFAQGLPEDEKKRVASRTGMLIIYVPATIVALLSISTSSTCTLAGLMCFIHFLKRTLEVLYLHKYSGTVELGISQFIGVFYAFITFMICMVSRNEVDPQVMRLAQGEFWKMQMPTIDCSKSNRTSHPFSSILYWYPW